MLGKRFGFVTPGEMLSTYFHGDAIRLLTVLVALCFSIPYLGLQLRASGFLFNVLTDGWLGVEVGMWLLSAIVFIYVAAVCAPWLTWIRCNVSCWQQVS